MVGRTKDYFSKQSKAYQQFRPSYPQALFDFFESLLPDGAIIWDCAAGSGQASVHYSDKVACVVATDQSDKQLAHAPAHPRVHYAQSMAEVTPFPDHSVDMVTVAQALHWFDFDAFFREAKRVVRPGGVVAAWTYSFLDVTRALGTEIDAAIRTFYYDVIGPHWPPERRFVDERYTTIPFPLAPIEAPQISIEVSWDLDGVMGYLATWSSVQRYKDAGFDDPLPEFRRMLEAVWPTDEVLGPVHWPLALKIGRT